MDKQQQLVAYLNNNPQAVGKVVDFNAGTDCLLPFDFTAANTTLDAATIADTAAFSQWVDAQLAQSGCRYGIGGYMEHRTLYARSALFNTVANEPRRLHLGVDIWGPAGTPVYAPLAGRVHSFQNNDHYGDYGPTIILEHDLNGLMLYSLYGHLNAASLDDLNPGMPVHKNQQLAVLGTAAENGSWPPHLHFQLMFDMQGHAGDYPGVGQHTQREVYEQNIPDPDLILQFRQTL